MTPERIAEIKARYELAMRGELTPVVWYKHDIPDLLAALAAAQERERVLRERLQALHDEADDVNAEWGLKDFLCLMCNADGWDAIVGVRHQPDCALLLARAALQEPE